MQLSGITQPQQSHLTGETVPAALHQSQIVHLLLVHPSCLENTY